jgi:CheY-like chemotaxis protein
MPKILLAEDDIDFADALSAALSALGCEVAVVRDGRAVIASIAAGKPDLAILSIELPELNGFRLCNRLKKDEALRALPVFLLTTEAPEQTLAEHRKLPTRAEAYFRKPLVFEHLAAELRTHVPSLGREAAPAAPPAPPPPPAAPGRTPTRLPPPKPAPPKPAPPKPPAKPAAKPATKPTTKAPPPPDAPPLPLPLPLPAPPRKSGPQSAGEDAAMPLLRSLLDEQGRAHQRLSRELAMVKSGSSLGDAAAVAELHTEIARLRRALDDTRAAEQAPLVLVPPGLTAAPKVEAPETRIQALEDKLAELGAALRLRDREAATAQRGLEEARKELEARTRDLEAERAARAPAAQAHEKALATVAASLERERAEARRKTDELEKSQAGAVAGLRSAHAAEVARLRKEGEAALARTQAELAEARRAAENAAQRERRFGEESDRRLSDLRAEVDTAKRDAQRLAEEAAKRDAELEAERGRVRAAEAAAEARMREVVADLQHRLADAEARADSPVPPSLLDEVEGERRKRAEAEAQAAASRAERDAAAAEIAKLTAARQDAERRQAEVTKASMRLSAELEAERTARTADAEAAERSLAEALEATTKIELAAADVRDECDRVIADLAAERARAVRYEAARRAEEAAAGDERLRARIAEVRAEAEATVTAAVRRANETETRVRDEKAAALAEAREQQKRVEREAFQAVAAADERCEDARRELATAQVALRTAREAAVADKAERERLAASLTEGQARFAELEAEIATLRSSEAALRTELRVRTDELTALKATLESDRADWARRAAAAQTEHERRIEALQGEREAAVAAAAEAGFGRLREAQTRMDEVVSALRADRDRALAETRAALDAAEAGRTEAVAAATAAAEAAQRELCDRHEARLLELTTVHTAALADVQRELMARTAERDGLAADYELKRARDVAERSRWVEEATTRVESDLEARRAASEEALVRAHQAEITALRDAHAADIEQLRRRISEITASSEHEVARHREQIEALTASRARDAARLNAEIDRARARVPELEAEAVALRTELTMARIQIDRETIVARSAREQLEREMRVLDKARAALEGVLGRVGRGEDSEPELRLLLGLPELEEHLLDAPRLEVDREQLLHPVDRGYQDRVMPCRERRRRLDRDFDAVDLHRYARRHAGDLEAASVGRRRQHGGRRGRGWRGRRRHRRRGRGGRGGGRRRVGGRGRLAGGRRRGQGSGGRCGGGLRLRAAQRDGDADDQREPAERREHQHRRDPLSSGRTRG